MEMNSIIINLKNGSYITCNSESKFVRVTLHMKDKTINLGKEDLAILVKKLEIIKNPTLVPNEFICIVTFFEEHYSLFCKRYKKSILMLVQDPSGAAVCKSEVTHVNLNQSSSI